MKYFLTKKRGKGNKKYVHIYQCQSGDIIAEDIYDQQGRLIIAKHVVINEYILRRLESLNIRQLSIFEDSIDIQEEENYNSSLLQFKKEYREKVNTIKEVLNDLAAGRKMDYEKVKQVSNSIYKKMNYIGNIFECINEVKNMDEYTYTHSINVSVYSLLIARWLGLSEEQTRNVVLTGILHDIGKTKVPVEILNKRGPLTSEEFEQMKKHAVYGYKIAKDIPELSNEIREGILMHHEREDGKGYPLGLKGDRISLLAKIISVADVYDALTSERVYKKRITPFDTFRELERLGYGHFDTKILMTFLANISSYYIGAKIKLNTGEIGKVIFINTYNIDMPIIFLNGEYIDLSQNKEYKIVEML